MEPHELGMALAGRAAEALADGFRVHLHVNFVRERPVEALQIACQPAFVEVARAGGLSLVMPYSSIERIDILPPRDPRT